MSIFSLAQSPPMLQIKAIERGLPSVSLTEIANKLGLPKQRIVASLRFAQRTITAREKNRKKFTPEESERLLRVVRLHHIVRQVFTDDAAVAQWLSTQDVSLGNNTPLDLLATDIGAAKVENLARAMMHGVPI